MNNIDIKTRRLINLFMTIYVEKVERVKKLKN